MFYSAQLAAVVAYSSAASAALICLDSVQNFDGSVRNWSGDA